MPQQQEKFGWYALVLLVLGVMGRLPAITLPGHSPMVIYFDGSYIQTAQEILHFNFHSLGNRTPVYPFLLLLCGLNPRTIWIAQSILGIAASLMIFDMAFRRTRHGLFSLLVGLACSLAPEVLIYESSIMTEALTDFGENRRFCVPFYMLIAYTLLTRGWLWITATTSKGSHAAPVTF